MKKIVLILVFIFVNSSLFSQIRVGVLPFQNMDGKMDKNKYCYSLQDTVYKLLLKEVGDGKSFVLVPSDSVEDALAALNLDPSNPQYESDLWKAVASLKIKKVVMGNFNINNGKFLINGYIYDTRMKLRDPNNQVRDIFKDEDKILECAPEIVQAILPAIKK